MDQSPLYPFWIITIIVIPKIILRNKYIKNTVAAYIYIKKFANWTKEAIKHIINKDKMIKYNTFIDEKESSKGELHLSDLLL